MPHLRPTVCLVGAALLALPLTQVQAQEAPPAPAPPSVQPDSALLLKAFRAISGAPTLSSESDLDLKGVKGGASVAIHEHLKLVSKMPSRFRSEVSLGDPGAGPVTRYEVVSDGQKVTVSQPGARQFSILSLKAFKATDDDLPALGVLVGQLYLGEFASQMVSVAKATGTSLADSIHSMNMSLTAMNDDAGLAVFTLTIPHTGRYVFSVDPLTSTLRQVELKGTDSGASFDLVEKIGTSGSAAVSPATFRWTAPAGFRKVKRVSIGTF